MASVLALAYLRRAELERWTVAQARTNVAAVMTSPPRPSRGGGRKPRTQEDPDLIAISSVDGVAAALTIRAQCSPEFIAVLVETLEGGDAYA